MEEEEITSDFREKIHKNVDKVFDKWLERASKGESIEGVIKSLMVEKVMKVLGAIMRRTVVKKVAKRAVRKAVDKYWEKNQATIQEKIKNL
ncbi:MAG: hypothetical protein ACFFCM_11195 [Promethearchaeota archaeon]